MEKDFSFLHYLKAVTADEQAYEGLNSQELWLFYVSETDVLGPFRQNDIKKLIPQFRHEFAPLKACTVSQKEWKPFFNHSCFNNRDLVKEQQPKTKFRKMELMVDHYLCLVNGVKKGPYSQNQIVELIKNKEIKSDALISADQGMTWHRAYTFPQFNRRTKQIVPEHQITMPDEAIEKTKLIVLDKIKKAENADSGAFSAALLSGKNKHLASEKLNNVFTEKLKKVSGFSFSNKGPRKKGTNPVFAVVMVLALIMLVFVDTETEEEKISNKDPLEVLQGIKNKKTSAKYEDATPPKPIKSATDSSEFESDSYSQKDAPTDKTAESVEDYPDEGSEEFDQDPNEYNDSSNPRTKRDISSSKKKTVKKLSVSHQEEDPNEGMVDEPEEENLVEESEDFELEQ
jgi:hypothetical protein